MTAHNFHKLRAQDLGDEGVRALLVESGLWTALRSRPFSRVADPASRPRSIFVTAMDSEPLAPDVLTVLRGREADFARGLAALALIMAIGISGAARNLGNRMART